MDLAREQVLPSVEERRRILDEAGVILAEAQALAHFLDTQRGGLEGLTQDVPVSFEAVEDWPGFAVLERHIMPRFFI
jgi:uncharacterized membrane-anchored protein